MRRSFYHTLMAALSVALLFLAAGCGEDPRYSAQTQYLGGVYGNAPAGPPQDSVSYWDGDSASGNPSITISLREQRAYFYKSDVLVGVSQLSTGREGLNTPYGHFSIIQKDINHVSSLFGDYVCLSSCASSPGQDYTQAICPVIPRRMAASECLNSWPKTFSNRSHSVRQSRSRIRFLGKRQHLGLQKIRSGGTLIIPPVEI